MEDLTLTDPTNNEITRINQISLEDDLKDEEKKRNALAILNITEKEPSEEIIAKAYKKLALKVHPDHNNSSEESEAATRKILVAKEILSKPSEKEETIDFMGGGYWKSSTIPTSPEDEARTQKMKGWIEHIRGILLTFSVPFPQSYLHDLSPTTRRHIVQFFTTPTLCENLKKSCQDKTYPDLKIKEDVINSQNWATKFFSDPYQDSSQAVNPYYGKLNLKYDELEAIHTSLLEMVNRYEFFKNKYRILFQETVFTCLTAIEETLISALSQFKSTKQSGKLPVAYQNFMHFAAAFVGQKESVANFSEDDLLDSATEEAFSFLDNLVCKKNPQLFSRLVSLANELRAQLEPKAAFIYSETNLEKDLEEAKKMDGLCNGHTRRSILNAQLSYFIFLIVGKYCQPEIVPELTERFPKISGGFESRFFAPSSVIPQKPSSTLIANYQKYYGNGYAFFHMFASETIISQSDGSHIISSNIKGKLEYLLRILQKTFAPRVPEVSFEEKQQASTKTMSNHSSETNKTSGLMIFFSSLLFLIFAGLISMGTLAATGNFDVAAYCFNFVENSTESLVTLFLSAAVVGVGFLYTLHGCHQPSEKETSLNMVFDEKDWEIRPSEIHSDQKNSYSFGFNKSAAKGTHQMDSKPNVVLHQM